MRDHLDENDLEQPFEYTRIKYPYHLKNPNDREYYPVAFGPWNQVCRITSLEHSPVMTQDPSRCTICSLNSLLRRVIMLDVTWSFKPSMSTKIRFS